jgi:hypothetical protein
VIWDTFTFCDELDVLEARFWELDGVVDRFVVCESPRAQSDGHDKPLHFAENAFGRFARWLPKVCPVAVKLDGVDPAGANASLEREAAQRDAIGQVLAEAAPDDLVLFGDVDEIPRPSAVKVAAGLDQPCVFLMTACYFAVDWVAPWDWVGTACCRAGDITSVAKMRDDRMTWLPLGGAGWHLSWLGGPEAIRAKVACRAQTQDNATVLAYADRAYAEGVVWHSPTGGEAELVGVGVDPTWPSWIVERKCPPIWFRPR